eukprot:3371604-Rhodomonas_salina.2
MSVPENASEDRGRVPCGQHRWFQSPESLQEEEGEQERGSCVVWCGRKDKKEREGGERGGRGQKEGVEEHERRSGRGRREEGRGREREEDRGREGNAHAEEDRSDAFVESEDALLARHLTDSLDHILVLDLRARHNGLAPPCAPVRIRQPRATCCESQQTWSWMRVLARSIGKTTADAMAPATPPSRKSFTPASVAFRLSAFSSCLAAATTRIPAPMLRLRSFRKSPWGLKIINKTMSVQRISYRVRRKRDLLREDRCCNTLQRPPPSVASAPARAAQSAKRQTKTGETRHGSVKIR